METAAYVRKILVLRDDPRQHDTVGEILEAEGYEVMTVAWDPLGLEIVLALNPELVVLDICLPGQSGQDYCRQIRRKSKTMPLLVLSAISDVATLTQLLQLGADDYVTKPFSAPEFMARVKASMRL